MGGCNRSDVPISAASNALSADKFLVQNYTDLISEKVNSFPNGTELAIGIIWQNNPSYNGITS